MKSPTDGFEDAEIDREEGSEREVLARIIDTADPDGGNVPDDGAQPHGYWLNVADAILAAGFSRQSPASTTAADAWDEGLMFGRKNLHIPTRNMRTHNPYRVAVPEGDGGNE